MRQTHSRGAARETRESDEDTGTEQSLCLWFQWDSRIVVDEGRGEDNLSSAPEEKSEEITLCGWHELSAAEPMDG